MNAKTVSDLATHAKTCVQIAATASLAEAVHAIRASGGLPLVVLQDDGIRGIVTERELILHGMQADGRVLSPSLTVTDVMTPVTVSITEDSTLADILPAWTEQRTMLPVTRQGRLIGVIRAADLLRVVVDIQSQHSLLARVTEEAEVFLSAPVWQSLMNLLAEAGI